MTKQSKPKTRSNRSASPVPLLHNQVGKVPAKKGQKSKKNEEEPVARGSAGDKRSLLPPTEQCNPPSKAGKKNNNENKTNNNETTSKNKTNNNQKNNKKNDEKTQKNTRSNDKTNDKHDENPITVMTATGEELVPDGKGGFRFADPRFDAMARKSRGDDYQVIFDDSDDDDSVGRRELQHPLQELPRKFRGMLRRNRPLRPERRREVRTLRSQQTKIVVLEAVQELMQIWR